MGGGGGGDIRHRYNLKRAVAVSRWVRDGKVGETLQTYFNLTVTASLITSFFIPQPPTRYHNRLSLSLSLILFY